MSWELGYLCGLLSGVAVAGLVGVFLHAQSWSEWMEAFDTMKATAMDWSNRFKAESERAAILDAKFGTLTDDLAGCRRHNADADADIDTLTASLAEAVVVREVAAALSAARLNCIDSLTDDADALRTECESLRCQVRGLAEAVQAVTGERNAAAAKADAATDQRRKLSGDFDDLNAAYQRSVLRAAACIGGLRQLVREADESYAPKVSS